MTPKNKDFSMLFSQNWEKVYFKAQILEILECPRISEFWNITGVLVCATDHFFVLHHWKLLAAIVLLGTKVNRCTSCMCTSLHTCLPSANLTRAFLAPSDLVRCFFRKQYKTESLTKTTGVPVLPRGWHSYTLTRWSVGHVWQDRNQSG